jgi:hypothetical protein
MMRSVHSVNVSIAGDPAAQRLYEFAPGVVVRFVTDRKDVLRHFDGEYGRVSVNRSSEPQIEVRVGEQSGLTASPGFLTYQGRHKTITWKVALGGVDDDTTVVAFWGKGAMAISFLQTFYLEPLLALKLLQAGYALVHGCAVVEGTRAVLFPGGTGVGKTTLALQQAIAGRAVQGDNYVIVGARGETYPFPRRLRIYSDIRRTNPDAFRRLTIRERLHLRLFGFLKTASFGFANMPRRLSVEQFVPGHVACPRAQLERVCFLRRYDGDKLLGPTPLTLEQLTDRIQAISRSEGSRLFEIAALYLAAHPESCLRRMPEMEREILAQALKGRPAFEILVPRVVNPGPLACEIGHISGLDEEGWRQAEMQR